MRRTMAGNVPLPASFHASKPNHKLIGSQIPPLTLLLWNSLFLETIEGRDEMVVSIVGKEEERERPVHLVFGKTLLATVLQAES